MYILYPLWVGRARTEEGFRLRAAVRQGVFNCLALDTNGKTDYHHGDSARIGSGQVPMGNPGQHLLPEMKLRHILTRPARAVFQALGYDVISSGALHHLRSLPGDFTEQDAAEFRAVEPFTMIPAERIYTLIRATEFVAVHAIAGAYVECGTWKGGCAMAAANTLLRIGKADRELYLFDLFGGPWRDPTEYDIHLGQHAEALSKTYTDEERATMDYTEDEVRRNVVSTGYPSERLHLVRGDVVETLAEHAPDSISLLRLDTDYYETTRHQLEVLYPRLTPGGILIIDDYGDWAGARKATDDYIAGLDLRLHLIRVDVGARMAVKPF